VEVIVLAVRWYLRYVLSYRDVEELLGERGLGVDHVTVYRWVQRFTPLLTTRPGPAVIELCLPSWMALWQEGQTTRAFLPITVGRQFCAIARPWGATYGAAAGQAWRPSGISRDREATRESGSSPRVAP
jgi:hypothetical protein